MDLNASGRPDPGARLLSLVTGALLAVLLVARPEIALDRWGAADPLAALWLLWSMLAVGLVLVALRHPWGWFRDALEVINGRFHCFSQVRGRSLLLGAVLTEAYQGKAKTFVDAGIDEGVLVLVAGGSVVRFAPALNLSREEFDLGMQRFARAVARVVGG